MNFLMDSFKDNTRQMIDIAIRDNASFLPGPGTRTAHSPGSFRWRGRPGPRS